MSALAKTHLTPQEYLALEHASDVKHEYVQGEIFAMSGAKPKHVLITSNILASLHSQLRQRDCTVYASDLRVRVTATGLYAYPDVVVVCGEPRYDDLDADTLVNPTVIVEVLSPSTEGYDRGKKFQLYQGNESFQEYVLVSQEQVYVEHFRREGRVWHYTPFPTLDSVVTLPSIDCTLRLSDVYEKVKFEDESD